MQVLLMILGLLLYLGVVYLWIKSNTMTSKWLLMFALVVLPSFMYYLIYVKSRGLSTSFINRIKWLDFLNKKHESKAEPALSADEAYKILELPAGADELAVIEAHRRLMVRNHPDNGGSAYIAAMLNQAKSTLTEM